MDRTICPTFLGIHSQHLHANSVVKIFPNRGAGSCSFWGVEPELVNPHEDRASFNTAVIAFSGYALMICDKSHRYHVSLVAAGTGHDSDVREIVDSRDP